MRRRTFLQLCSASALASSAGLALRGDEAGQPRLMHVEGRPKLPGSRFDVVISTDLLGPAELVVALESPGGRRVVARRPAEAGERITVVTPQPIEGEETGVHVVALKLVRGTETLDVCRPGGYEIGAYRFSA